MARFHEKFDETANTKLQEPLHKARACIKVGRFELAATFYNEALKLQPGNWVLLNEISSFLTFQLRDVKAGIDMAKAALSLNPTLSADLWNTLGDGLYEWGRTAEARSAYLRPCPSTAPTFVHGSTWHGSTRGRRITLRP